MTAQWFTHVLCPFCEKDHQWIPPLGAYWASEMKVHACPELQQIIFDLHQRSRKEHQAALKRERERGKIS